YLTLLNNYGLAVKNKMIGESNPLSSREYERPSCKSHKGGGEMMQAEIEESNLHSREFWKLFAKASPGGEVFDRNGLSIANAKQPWFFMNVGMLNKPVADASDLRHRALEALEHFEPGKNPWVLTASEDWFGPDSDSILSSVGLERKLGLTGMLAERLTPSRWPCQTRSSGASRMRRADSLSRMSMQT